MAREVKIGIIGVGQIGKNHIDEYQRVSGAKLVAVADLNEAEARRVAAQYNIPHAFRDFRDLLKLDEVEAVDVCLHNNFHMPMTVAALEAGKNVYCEKPMAGSYIDALKMMETAKRCNRKLSIQLSTLFSKETKFAKRLIDDGHLGKLYHARSTGYRRRGRPYVDGYGTQFFVSKKTAQGGALFDMGVYHISEVLYLLGLPKVERISGQIYQETEMDEERRKKSGYDVEELGVGLVHFAGGMTLDIIESWAVHQGPFGGSSIFGAKGGISLDPFAYYNNMSDATTTTTFDLGDFDWREHQLREDVDVLDGPQHHWVGMLQGRGKQLPTAETALMTMLISEGIYLSARLGREVTADEIVKMSKSTSLDVTPAPAPKKASGRKR